MSVRNITRAIALLFTAMTACTVSDRSYADTGVDKLPLRDLICFTDTPVLKEGDSAQLEAWAVPSDKSQSGSVTPLVWKVSSGVVQSSGHTVAWDLSQTRLGDDSYREVIATVSAEHAQCEVRIILARDTSIPSRGEHGRISAWKFLLPNQNPTPGFGLYSYLLLSNPPKNSEERDRYLKTIEGCLNIMRKVEEYMSLHVRRKQLNVTYIPVKRAPSGETSDEKWASEVLAAYNYAESGLLLAQLEGDHGGGPYLISFLRPLSRADDTVESYLSEDLSGVAPSQAWDWVRNFSFLAAQQRSWSDATLKLIRLKIRNLIAVGGQLTPDTLDQLDRAVKVTSALSK